MPKKTDIKPEAKSEDRGSQEVCSNERTSDAEESSSPQAHDPKDVVGLLRRNLKVLLFHLARQSEVPSQELEKILGEVITELYYESKEALEDKKKHLRLVSTGASP